MKRVLTVLVGMLVVAVRPAEAQETPPESVQEPSPESVKKPTPVDDSEPEPEAPSETKATPEPDARPEPEATAKPDAKPAPAAAPASATPTRLLVHTTLHNSPLEESQILAGLVDEFDVPVQSTPSEEGLQILVDGSTLTMSYRESPESVIERSMTLPDSPDAQIQTIVLLAGNLARDEAGALIAELRAQGQKSSVPPPPLPAATEESEARDADDAVGAAKEAVTPPSEDPVSDDPASTNEEPAPAPDEEEGEEEGTEQPPTTAPLSRAYGSASLFGPLSFPRNLQRKVTHGEVGLAFSDIGALEGGAFTLLVLRNRGLGERGAGFGIQGSLVATLSQADFIGGVFSLGVASSRGAVVGGVAGGLVSIQKGELLGGQAAGLVATTRGDLTGAQLGVLATVTKGDLLGLQGSALVAVTRGNLSGAQLASLVNVTAGRVKGLQMSALVNVNTEGLRGVQLGLVNVTPEHSGFQLGLVNSAHRQMGGFQLGLINIGGETEGTQVGLVNVAVDGKGKHVGLVNIAPGLEGTSVAPINIIPGVRNQVTADVSYASDSDREGTAAGPIYRLGLKFLPQPFFTQLNFGLAPETLECVDTDAGEQECFGGGLVFSPAVSFGLRTEFGARLYAEWDLGYQYEKAFNDSRSSRHGALARAALGVQLTPDVALFAGGGPRVNFHEGPRVRRPPDAELGWHAFGGVAFF